MNWTVTTRPLTISEGDGVAGKVRVKAIHRGERGTRVIVLDMSEEQAARFDPQSAWDASLRADHRHARALRERTGPCPCECNSGGFCGGCGHAGCGQR